MKIAYIDGRRLKRGLMVGARRLIESAGLLDRINVFPVADGDTGSNLAATIRALSNGLAATPVQSIGATARLAADAALYGARGNSGAIMAQFFHGLAEDLASEVRVGTKRFATALQRAAASAREALSIPVEGTIVTVLRDWADAAHRVAQKTDDFMEMLHVALDAARVSLERTKNMLPELKKAGVVDAGALGFVRLMEGISAYIQHGRIRDLPSETPDADAQLFDSVIEAIPGDGSEPALRYCVEALVAGIDMDASALRAGLEAIGDSIVVAGSPRHLKAHVHSNHPDRAFRAMEAIGTVEQPKVDDMTLQARRATAGHRPCAVVVDSASDFPDRLRLDLGVEQVPVQVIMGETSRLDGVGMSVGEFIDYLRGSPSVYPTTSQPSHVSFARKFDLALAHADEAVYIGIAEKLSGTLAAGKRAAFSSANAARLHIVDSGQLSVAAGLVARKAAEVAAGGGDARAVIAAAEDAVSRARLLVAAPSLEGLIRSGRLTGMKGLAARAFGIRPVLTVGKDGKADSAGMYLGARNGIPKILALVAGAVPEGYPLEAVIGHVDAPDDANALAEALAERYGLQELPVVTTISPALAAHAGLGAVALGFLLPKAD